MFDLSLTAIRDSIILFLALSFLCETMTEYLAGPIRQLLLRQFRVDIPMRYAAAVVGIALAFVYGLDILLALGFAPKAAWTGLIITGLILGRGSNYTHDFLGLFKALTDGKVIPAAIGAIAHRRG